jgi:hypothetical protein
MVAVCPQEHFWSEAHVAVETPRRVESNVCRLVETVAVGTWPMGVGAEGEWEERREDQNTYDNGM